MSASPPSPTRRSLARGRSSLRGRPSRLQRASTALSYAAYDAKRPAWRRAPPSLRRNVARRFGRSSSPLPRSLSPPRCVAPNRIRYMARFDNALSPATPARYADLGALDMAVGAGDAANVWGEVRSFEVRMDHLQLKRACADKVQELSNPCFETLCLAAARLLPTLVACISWYPPWSRRARTASPLSSSGTAAARLQCCTSWATVSRAVCLSSSHAVLPTHARPPPAPASLQPFARCP